MKTYYRIGGEMSKPSLTEILSKQQEFREKLTEMMFRNPHMTFKEFAQEIRIGDQTLRRFLYKDKDLNSKAMIIIFNYLCKKNRY